MFSDDRWPAGCLMVGRLRVERLDHCVHRKVELGVETRLRSETFQGRIYHVSRTYPRRLGHLSGDQSNIEFS